MHTQAVSGGTARAGGGGHGEFAHSRRAAGRWCGYRLVECACTSRANYCGDGVCVCVCVCVSFCEYFGAVKGLWNVLVFLEDVKGLWNVLLRAFGKCSCC